MRNGYGGSNERINLKTTIMKIQSIKLGIAFASTGIVMYLGCMALMAFLGHDGTVWFFNSILHGFDTETIVRMEVPLAQTALGILLTVSISGFSGWLIASVYNRSMNLETTND